MGLLHLVDAGVTSAARAARKPHPGIYAVAVESLDVDPRQVLFVGDSWEADVRGPRRRGMAAVHVWRAEERRGQRARRSSRATTVYGELTGVLDLLGLPPPKISGT